MSQGVYVLGGTCLGGYVLEPQVHIYIHIFFFLLNCYHTYNPWAFSRRSAGYARFFPLQCDYWYITTITMRNIKSNEIGIQGLRPRLFSLLTYIKVD